MVLEGVAVEARRVLLRERDDQRKALGRQRGHEGESAAAAAVAALPPPDEAPRSRPYDPDERRRDEAPRSRPYHPPDERRDDRRDDRRRRTTTAGETSATAAAARATTTTTAATATETTAAGTTATTARPHDRDERRGRYDDEPPTRDQRRRGAQEEEEAPRPLVVGGSPAQAQVAVQRRPPCWFCTTAAFQRSGPSGPDARRREGPRDGAAAGSAEGERGNALSSQGMLGANPEPGKVYRAVVERCQTFGAFCKTEPEGFTGMIHTSEFGIREFRRYEGPQDAEAVVPPGSRVYVLCKEIKDGNKVALSLDGVNQENGTYDRHEDEEVS